MLYHIFLILSALFFAALLELGRCTLAGWLAAAGAFCAYIVLHRAFFSQARFLPRLGGALIFLLVLAGVFRLFQPPIRPVPAVEGKSPEKTGVVTVAEGQLRGVYNGNRSVEVYAGIPFAAPPVGELRWKPPEDPLPWEGVRNCDHFAPMAMQSRTNTVFDSLTHIAVYHDFKISLKDNWLPDMSEDCLYLNVWKPAGEIKNAPVLVFIHGGSLSTGQSWYGDYNGEALARQGIVAVTIAYRLNVFGYFADEELLARDGTTGNYGLLDQIRALRWVRENIAAFGGDPEQITLAGESAGASSVNALCVSPLTEGMFRRVIAESSGITPRQPYHTFRPLEKALETGRAIRQEFGAASVEELLALDAETLIKTAHANNSMTVDGYAITEQPWLTYERGANHEEALLNGFNAHEATFFTLTDKVTSENYVEKLSHVLGKNAAAAAELYPPEPVENAYHYIVEAGGDAKGAYDQVLSAVWFTYSHHDWSRYIAGQGRDVYEYYFTKDNGGLGSNHSGEMMYAYGNVPQSRLYTAEDHALSDTMLQYWANFIRNGDPNGPGLPAWQKYNDAPGTVLELGDAIAMREDPHRKLYELIDDYQRSLP